MRDQGGLGATFLFQLRPECWPEHDRAPAPSADTIHRFSRNTAPRAATPGPKANFVFVMRY